MSLDLESKQGALRTLERLGRAVLAGAITPAEHRELLSTIRAALDVFAERNPARGERATAAIRAHQAAQASQDYPGQPETHTQEQPDDHADEDEPTFEERVIASARERAARATGP
jgi:hypothetical protein